MTMLRFNDGVAFDTSGSYRIEGRRDGLYVVGGGFLCAVASREEGEFMIASLTRKDKPTFVQCPRCEAPVRYERGVGHWISPAPQGRPDATVAWAAPLTKDPTRQAVVYQMTWTNPRPDVEIRTIDVVAGEGYGMPAVLGITAGSAR